MALSGIAQAGPILEFSSGVATNVSGGDTTLGWEFTTGNAPITVTALDAYLDGVNLTSTTVRLYGLNGTTIVSATVNTSDATEGSPFTFYTSPITPTTLAANTTYYVAEDAPNGSGVYVYVNGVTTDPSISYVGPVATSATGQNPMTDGFNGALGNYFGPNFDIGPAAVPEPSSLALCGLAGVFGSVVAWRKRKRRSA